MTAGRDFSRRSSGRRPRGSGVWGGVSPHRGWDLGRGLCPSPEIFLAEINAFWWDFDAVLIPIEMHNYRPTSTYILLGGSGLQSNLVLVHSLTQSEPYDYEYEFTTPDGLWSYVESSIRPTGLPPAGCTNKRKYLKNKIKSSLQNDVHCRTCSIQ